MGSPRGGPAPEPGAEPGTSPRPYAARMPEAWIIDGVRSPRGRGKETGSLHDIHPQELLAQVLNALVDRVGVDRGSVEDVIIGNNSNVGDHGNVIGRMSVLAAGWPDTTPGFIVNRFCGSGQ